MANELSDLLIKKSRFSRFFCISCHVLENCLQTEGFFFPGGCALPIRQQGSCRGCDEPFLHPFLNPCYRCDIGDNAVKQHSALVNHCYIQSQTPILPFQKTGLLLVNDKNVQFVSKKIRTLSNFFISRYCYATYGSSFLGFTPIDLTSVQTNYVFY